MGSLLYFQPQIRPQILGRQGTSLPLAEKKGTEITDSTFTKCIYDCPQKCSQHSYFT